jgi:8-oxo-dGTP pyrophosphatase MutT (NUDIX family)
VSGATTGKCMADPSSLRIAAFGMPLIRQRVMGRVPRSAMLDSAIVQLSPTDAPQPAQKRAAVATILRERSHGPELLLIRRAEHPRDPWSGHMAFPGGREEPSDLDLLETAIRETQEEVSLDLRSHGQLLGRLDELPAVARGRRTGLTIAPFVFELTQDVELQHNHEVAEVVWTPLEPMFRGQRATTFAYEISGQQLSLPAHDIQGRIVWGLTYRMLESLFSLLR